MHDSTPASLDTALAAYLRTLSGANKSAATIRAYRTDLVHNQETSWGIAK
jgi:hypothetical protein